MFNEKIKDIDNLSSDKSILLSSLNTCNLSETNFTIKSFIMSGNQAGIKCPSEYVKLNIGGSLHYTTISTLRKI